MLVVNRSEREQSFITEHRHGMDLAVRSRLPNLAGRLPNVSMLAAEDEAHLSAVVDPSITANVGSRPAIQFPTEDVHARDGHRQDIAFDVRDVGEREIDFAPAPVPFHVPTLPPSLERRTSNLALVFPRHSSLLAGVPPLTCYSARAVGLE